MGLICYLRTIQPDAGWRRHTWWGESIELLAWAGGIWRCRPGLCGEMCVNHPSPCQWIQKSEPPSLCLDLKHILRVGIWPSSSILCCLVLQSARCRHSSTRDSCVICRWEDMQYRKRNQSSQFRSTFGGISLELDSLHRHAPPTSRFHSPKVAYSSPFRLWVDFPACTLDWPSCGEWLSHEL